MLGRLIVFTHRFNEMHALSSAGKKFLKAKKEPDKLGPIAIKESLEDWLTKRIVFSKRSNTSQVAGDYAQFAGEC